MCANARESSGRCHDKPSVISEKREGVTVEIMGVAQRTFSFLLAIRFLEALYVND